MVIGPVSRFEWDPFRYGNSPSFLGLPTFLLPVGLYSSSLGAHVIHFISFIGHVPNNVCYSCQQFRLSLLVTVY
jgi:hypothetical protein